MKIRSLLAVVLVVLIPCQPILAWSEGGHHIIAALAFQMLPELDKQSIIEILKSHPQFDSEFRIPAGIQDANQTRLFLAGRAGYWPDVARGYEELNRPTWHYQLGSSMVLGNANAVKVHVTPPESPGNATLDTQELQIVQALELCKATLKDKSKSASDRALAICWIAHLVGDAHQPCHAGSLYAEGLFPEGDRGANSIPTIQRKNLHALWDGLLGVQFDAGDVRKRMFEITSDASLVAIGKQAIQSDEGLLPETWLRESRIKSVGYVYTPEVVRPLVEALEAGNTSLRPINLSDDYLKRAGKVSQERAIQAAYRLSKVWEGELGE